MKTFRICSVYACAINFIDVRFSLGHEIGLSSKYGFLEWQLSAGERQE